MKRAIVDDLRWQASSYRALPSDSLQERNHKPPLPQQRIYTQTNANNVFPDIALYEIFTKRPRQFARANIRAVINGIAAVDRATFAHRASPGAENWPTEGKAQLYF
ncbi:hypothetical protein AEQ67_27090 [Pseudomonas sp. RIT-PI-q]|uniref:hypothetical protein n=1 Tax=Pseudomonas sp. RIT-PI-q TaxID=1690247 RepID=UPI0006CC2079|nr:hypothetical protein [Pseudomonas sp. RIT-PI-q]KPG92551.1 hypothetical protein AEQ67_27090 [Pseudomonas sp. RIT-PI-q]